MLNQNIALILSALLGGALTVIGGFAANYTFKTMQDRKEKWRELRNIVEKMYGEINAVKLLYLSIIQHINIEVSFVAFKEFYEINEHNETIRMLVHFYVPGLSKDFANYLEGISITQQKIQTHIANKEKPLEETLEALNELENTCTNFHLAIIKLVKNKGYSYL